MKIENLDNKFDGLFHKISKESFLKMEALGGEIPFYITAFNPVQQVEVDKHVGSLKNRLENNGISILEINLYDLCIEMLTKRGLLDKILDKEKTMNRNRFLKVIQPPLDIESNLAPVIADRINSKPSKIVFLTGIGLVYPYIRSHTILNNLQSVIKNVSTVIFFPGIYNGNSLQLFGRLKDDNYYRAFNLDKLKS
jgi:hypothetical protein